VAAQHPAGVRIHDRQALGGRYRAAAAGDDRPPRPRVHLHTDGADAESPLRQDRAVPGVEEDHALPAVVHDQDAPGTLVDGQLERLEAQRRGAQQRTAAGVEDADRPLPHGHAGDGRAAQDEVGGVPVAGGDEDAPLRPSDDDGGRVAPDPDRAQQGTRPHIQHRDPSVAGAGDEGRVGRLVYCRGVRRYAERQRGRIQRPAERPVRRGYRSEVAGSARVWHRQSL